MKKNINIAKVTQLEHFTAKVSRKMQKMVFNIFKLIFFNIVCRYAVLDGNACLCSNTINEKELNYDECNRPCADNTPTNEMSCGGEYAQSIYDTDIKVAGVPENSQILDRKETSIIVQWSEPEQMNSLSRYIIRANIIKKYGTKVLPPTPQWTVERSDHDVQYELLNLNPGKRELIVIKQLVFFRP